MGYISRSSKRWPLLMFYILAYWLVVVGFVLTLVKYGQRGPDRAACEYRLTSKGIIGNQDYYGLGIRLGIYLQWTSSLIAHAQPKERLNVALPYAAFTVALLVAQAMLTFQHECVFSVEVIVVLYFLWAGLYVSFDYLLDNPASRLRRFSSLIPLYLVLFICIYSSWFWIRICSVGEKDFVSSPNGTSFFLWTRVNMSHQRLGAKLMIAFSFIGGFSRGIIETLLRCGNFQVPWVLLRTLLGIWSIIAIEITLYWNAVTNVYAVNTPGQVIPLTVGLGSMFAVCARFLRYKPRTQDLAQDILRLHGVLPIFPAGGDLDLESRISEDSTQEEFCDSGISPAASNNDVQPDKKSRPSGEDAEIDEKATQMAEASPTEGVPVTEKKDTGNTNSAAIESADTDNTSGIRTLQTSIEHVI